MEKVNLISNFIMKYEIKEDENTDFSVIELEPQKQFMIQKLYLNKNLLEKLPTDFIKNENFKHLKHIVEYSHLSYLPSCFSHSASIGTFLPERNILALNDIARTSFMKYLICETDGN